MKKTRFILIFLGSFALLLFFWRLTAVGRWYTDGVLGVAGIVGPLLHGWVLEPPAGDTPPMWARGADQVRTAIQFDALAVGLVPLMALLMATPGLSWFRRGVRIATGIALSLLVDSLIVALFPLLVFYKNPFTDVIGTFLGLVAFVGAPVIIWFGLTFHELRGWLPALAPKLS